MSQAPQSKETVADKLIEIAESVPMATALKGLLRGLAVEVAGEIERLKRFERMHDEATHVYGDDEVLGYVRSGNAIPVTRCTVSADLIRQLLGARNDITAEDRAWAAARIADREAEDSARIARRRADGSNERMCDEMIKGLEKVPA